MKYIPFLDLYNFPFRFTLERYTFESISLKLPANEYVLLRSIPTPLLYDSVCDVSCHGVREPGFYKDRNRWWCYDL